MPRPNLPPTPISSTEMKGQDGSQQLTPLHLTFELPPPAMADGSQISPRNVRHESPRAGSTSSFPVQERQANHVQQHAIQASETVKARRRSAASASKDPKEVSFALPPPPTRSRKIIQMKPGPQTQSPEMVQAEKDASSGKGSKKSTGKGTQPASGKDNSTAASGAAGKKKQAGATTAAGRKMARKTAHSLIERRRRSKMNEEFGVLKNMIPACTGEMHKLAILQASIEYIRYLEDCVNKLKEQHADSDDPDGKPTLPSIRDFHLTFQDDTGDVDMTDSEAVTSPTFSANPDQGRLPSVSPALLSQEARQRQYSYSSVSTADLRHYSYTGSTSTSPMFGPNPNYPGGHPLPHQRTPSVSGSTLTSPALGPQTDADQEVTAALLMLNSDRRESAARADAAARGMSVRDLLGSS